jgi:peptidoglycan glycosyltransferase
MNYKTGEILCAVTTPNYDPDDVPNMDADDTGTFEGVYMNRFTQSVYIPGSIFKIVTAAAALEEIGDIREQTFTCTGEVDYGAYDVTCEKVHGKLDFDSALAQSCNCAFSRIVEQLGKEKMEKYVDKYGITDSVTFDGITTAKGNFDLTDASRLDVAWSGIGQHKDQVNPCRYLTFVSAIANDGLEVQPHVMQSVTCGNKTTYQAATKTGERIMSQKLAQELQSMMRNNVIEKYGVENFPDLEVCGKSGTAQVGADREANAMFTGFVLDEEHPIAFFVAVEDAGYGRQVCVPILAKVLEAYLEQA